MAVSKAIIADVSSLSVGGSAIEAAQSFQVSRNAETRPINGFGSALPLLIVSSLGPGNGSFSYVASDGGNSTGDKNWATTLNGSAVLTCSGASYPTGTTAVIACSGCAFAGQSMSMNAKAEMVINVSFIFASGTW